MRIRKRPPASVEAARAPPASNEKSSSSTPGVSGASECRGFSGVSSNPMERMTGGHLESSQVTIFEGERFVTEKTYHKDVQEEQVADRHQNSEPAEEDKRIINGSIKHEDNAGAELLMRSLLMVFERTGNSGLTAREAVAKLVEYNLPGLQEGIHERSSVQVVKVLRTQDFIHLEDGKYYIYNTTHSVPHAVVAETSSESSQQPREDMSGNSPSFDSGRRKRVAGSVQTRLKTAVGSKGTKDKSSNCHILGIDLPLAEKVEFKKRRRRPPSSQHELAIGPRQCKRYDGRGWQCTRETEEGFSFCEHHQALMNKRTLRLNLAKTKKTGAADVDVNLNPELHSKVAIEGSSENYNQVPTDKADIENPEHNQRRRGIKARSLKSIK
ncbi:uncharacterized protein [Physcomitrium patens]|nr:uncharacterized protein LOC112285711 [Physcomitrium patens]|eukprot:XP_024382504.1 uncharacterized protein LOC112285711 [Physcomitrella patens]